MSISEEPVEVLMDFHHIKKVALIIRALNNSYRQRIFLFLMNAENRTVTEIVENVGLKQSVISQHLAILRKAKIVSYLKKGKYVYYHVNKERVTQIHTFINRLLDDQKSPLIRKEM